MKILVLTNLYPPHHAGMFDHHCQTVTESLRLRGHTIFILTSNHGLRHEQRDDQIDRRLRLNGAFGHPAVAGFGELKDLELHNHEVLREAIERFEPDVIHVFSLTGLSKSLVFTLYNSRRPVVYDVFDHWLTAGVREDPWMRFWNAPSLPFLENSKRKALELSGERLRLDSTAPTRMGKGYDRMPPLFAEGRERAAVEPNSIGGFRLDHIYFCSQGLRHLAEQVGFCVRHAEVIYPCISAAYVGEIKPPGAPMKKFLVAAQLDGQSGVMTALKALKIARAAKLDFTISIYGRGDSSYVADLRSFVLANQLPVEFLAVSKQNTDLPNVLKQHDAYLHTAEWAEPFPFTAMEAMGCGLPVIGARAGAVAELLRHGENSLTYPAGDAEQMAARIQEMLVSPALRIQMAEAAQEEVLSSFNETNVINQIENFLANSQAQTG